jgi:hypothetical protein
MIESWQIILTYLASGQANRNSFAVLRIASISKVNTLDTNQGHSKFSVGLFTPGAQHSHQVTATENLF